jgi:hypothetical protein
MDSVRNFGGATWDSDVYTVAGFPFTLPRSSRYP